MKNKYFTIIAHENGQLTISSEGFIYNHNGQGWTETTTETSIGVEKGDEVMLAVDEEYESDVHPCDLKFQTNFWYKAEGNIMSLSYGHRFRYKTRLRVKEEFAELFVNDCNLAFAENLVLPATVLTDGCYFRMFAGCTNLIAAPKILPATVLTDSCYMEMFSGCKSLMTTPELPAKELADRCYYDMFYACSKAPLSPVTLFDNFDDFDYERYEKKFKDAMEKAFPRAQNHLYLVDNITSDVKLWIQAFENDVKDIIFQEKGYKVKTMKFGKDYDEEIGRVWVLEAEIE